eukprot:TRINITY_DN48669_c0_g1_i1.p1 TRINITY_DN48669_c0_g1~~TRINITY_DN48669_c0_g1_i1.p1  ORF type:complete len:513 (-),score=107.72 TRINITY_DN48669_c0_g1_i1:37-1476(-)
MDARGGYEPLRSSENNGYSSDDERRICALQAEGSLDGTLLGRAYISCKLSTPELKDLYKASGAMPATTQMQEPASRPLDAAIRRVQQLDNELHEFLEQLFVRIRGVSNRTSACDQLRGWLRFHLRLGVVRRILPTTIFYVAYSCWVAWYVSESTDDWDVSWTAMKQDSIYYPAVVLAFILCFRTSGCMDRYKEGLNTSFLMEKALREVCFEVMTDLSVDDVKLDTINDVAWEGGSGVADSDKMLKYVRKRYFKHEFRRLSLLLFACAARDLQDSALQDRTDELDDDLAKRLPFAVTDVEHASVKVTHSVLGHAFRVYLAASWVTKLVKQASDHGFFDGTDTCTRVSVAMSAFKGAWLDARQIAYSSMPQNVTHLLWLITTIMSFFMPWEWVTVCRWNTWIPSMLLSVSFFGIMEIASILENPFGFDDDDIQLWKVAQHLDEEICITMHYSTLDEFGGENIYRNLMGKRMVFLSDEAARR